MVSVRADNNDWCSRRLRCDGIQKEVYVVDEPRALLIVFILQTHPTWSVTEAQDPLLSTTYAS